MKFNKFFKIVFIILICFAVFFFCSIAFMGLTIKNENEADKKSSSEPYVFYPTNSGILFKFESGENLFIYLNFTEKYSIAKFADNSSETRIGKYTVDYTVNADYALVAGIIDRLGGIEQDGTRYTGVQITEMLASSTQRKEKEKIIYEIFEKIKENGFSKEDFVYIIKNTGTDLLVPDCFYWEEHMKEIASDFEVIS